MNYNQAVHYLYSLGNEVHTAKLGLERITALLVALGNPHRAFRSVHVAGTNGKGSTSAMIEAGLRASGLRTGLYTSPHLIEPTERIRIAGEPVTEAGFAAAFDQVHETAERMLEAGELDLHPTYFEAVTAMGFLLFQLGRVDIAAVEVGLGGRLDATNVVAPEVSVITPIDYDHQAFLGDSIEQIAAEKAGIVKPGIPAIFARQRPEADGILRERAESVGAPYRSTSDWPIGNVSRTRDGCRFTAGGIEINCPLAGEHQIENALAAARTLDLLGVSAAGIAQTKWPGRLERVRANPDIVLDGAHNPAGARALAAYITRFYGSRPVWLIFGAMRDKAIEEMTQILFPLAQRVIVTAPNNSRAMPPDEIRALARSRVEVAATVREAMAIACQAPPETAVFFAGSLFLAGEARALLAAT